MGAREIKYRAIWGTERDRDKVVILHVCLSKMVWEQKEKGLPDLISYLVEDIDPCQITSSSVQSH